MKTMHIGLILGTLVFGCGRDASQQAPGNFGTSTGAVVMSNGRMLNGRMLNGRMLNGISFGGDALTQPATLDGTKLTIYDALGNPISGSDLVGVHLTGHLAQTDGESDIDIRFDDVSQDGSDPEIWLYSASYNDPERGWSPLCTDPVPAAAVAGRWNYGEGVDGGGAHIDDPNTFTLACNYGAIFKCLSLVGYKPWLTYNQCDDVGNCQDVSGADLHQACIRMIRADYCGDGTSHTIDGTPIDVVDNVGVQFRSTDDPAASYVIEAEWTRDGSPCVARVRHPEDMGLVCPDGIDRFASNCGDPTHYWAASAPALVMDYTAAWGSLPNHDGGGEPNNWR